MQLTTKHHSSSPTSDEINQADLPGADANPDPSSPLAFPFTRLGLAESSHPNNISSGSAGSGSVGFGAGDSGGHGTLQQKQQQHLHNFMPPPGLLLAEPHMRKRLGVSGEPTMLRSVGVELKYHEKDAT
ncbi:unnamed protein product [Protopolystoma xenopodis]|uniref:Uncharacterized protein n=1 Tax=Protopolystoma xenopodis TaxID=117903 RepID=A0A448XNF1_9PLAT|nr:unnamed protein product [Protopolystoma xenopodis]